MKGLRKSVYHRIMFGMNAADILQSIAIAFTTLPMPKDMIYSFKGVVIGNHTSCQVQGFFLVFGWFMGMMYNAALSIYYLCSINYNMMDQQFRKCLEPCLHVIAIFGGFVVAVSLGLADMYHPSPSTKAWCGVSRYPYWCEVSDDDCDAEPVIAFCFVCILTGGIAGVCSTVIVGTMILIVHKVRRLQRIRTQELQKYRSQIYAQIASDNLLQTTKTVMKQAMAYTVVNLLGIVSIIIVPTIMQRSFDLSKPTPVLQIIFLAFRPLQGFFNAIIFITLKVHSFRRMDPTINIHVALKRLLKGEEAPDRIMSDMIIVQQDAAIMRLRKAQDAEEVGDDDDDDDNEYGPTHKVGEINEIEAPSSTGGSFGGSFPKSPGDEMIIHEDDGCD